MSDLDKLEIVDENDNVIGLETREKIHREGLLHREIHIYFITPEGGIILQHRAKDKDTYPDKLDATVGGHVEPNMTYEETAVKECKEETGLDIDVNDLVLMKKMSGKFIDKDTGKINNAITCRYAYLYDGSVSKLVVEKGKAEGFEVRDISSLHNLSNMEKDKFIPANFDAEILNLLDKAKDIFGIK